MINRTHNQPSQGELRRELRTHGTSAEATLWLMLKAKQVEGVKFRRQFSVGPYVLDFYSPELRLCIELDGQSHFTPEVYEHDRQRTEYLNRLHDIRTIRFENEDVFRSPEGVLSEIRTAINKLRKRNMDSLRQEDDKTLKRCDRPLPLRDLP
jgi:very-short-patch-repair endonuclease